MELETGLCTVRSWRWQDEKSLVRHANNRRVWINLHDRFPHPYTAAHARDWIGRVLTASPETSFAIAVGGGDAAGGIGFQLRDDVLRRSAEVGYWLAEDFWGRGIATAAVRAVSEHAFETHDLCRLYAHVFEWNPASMRVLEKAGYTCEGRLRRSVTKDGRTIDQLLYARIRED